MINLLGRSQMELYIFIVSSFKDGFKLRISIFSILNVWNVCMQTGDRLGLSE